MADPIQQFIQNHMAFENFKAQERQFGAQQALVQRQIENQELMQFAQLAPFVEQPEQRATLAREFAGRVPGMADAFTALAGSIPISEQVYRSRLLAQGMELPGLAEEAAASTFAGQTRGGMAVSGAMAGRSIEDLTQGLRTAEGLELNAAQREQVNQFIQSFFEGQRQFDRTAGQRDWQLSQGDRQLGIEETRTAQQGVRDQLNFMSSIGEGRPMLRGDLSQQIYEVDRQLQVPMLTPEARRSLEARRGDLENAARQLDNRIQAEMAALFARGGGGADAMSLNQLVQAEQTAWTQISNAKSPGERQAAIERYNDVVRRRMAAGGAGVELEQGRSINPLNWFLGRPGPAQVAETPFNRVFGGQ